MDVGCRWRLGTTEQEIVPPTPPEKVRQAGMFKRILHGDSIYKVRIAEINGSF
jgi:hypothetical protein